MRKVQQYVLKDQEVFVGIEDAKKTWKLCVRSGGRVVADTKMEARYEILEAYLRNRFPGCAVSAIYEAGFSGFGLYDSLTADGHRCVVTPPHTVTERKSNKQKNDRWDCRRLAKNLENNDYAACDVPDKQRREDRQISRNYGQLHNDIVRVKNRIRRLLEWHGLDKDLQPGRWTDKQYIELPEKLAAMGLSESLGLAFRMWFELLQHLREQKRVLLKALAAVRKNERHKSAVQILKSAPGIGSLTATRLALEWGDVSRFKRKEQFASFTGLVPSDFSTGERERRGHITGEGNRGVRKWLIESAWVSIRKDPVMLDKFSRVFNSSGSKKIAIVAVARKLAIRLRALLMQQQLYQLGIVE
jgi:transposase